MELFPVSSGQRIPGDKHPNLSTITESFFLRAYFLNGNKLSFVFILIIIFKPRLEGDVVPDYDKTTMSLKNEKPIRLIIALAGEYFSGVFVDSWWPFIRSCKKSAIEPIISINYDQNSYNARNLCLGADVSRGCEQAPFNGLEYDFILWIEPDISFKTSDVLTLLSYDVDVVSGVCVVDSENQCNCGRFGIGFLERNFNAPAYTYRELKEENGDAELKNVQLKKTDWVGFEFLLIRKGIFEQLRYPWFRPSIGVCRSEGLSEVLPDAMNWCLDMKRIGCSLWVDPNILVHKQQLRTI